MSLPRVSIIIPAYNAGKYIAATIESVLDQTFDDYEIMIINDGSTDNTEEIVKPYLINKRIRYIYQENKGQANARNHGIKESKGSLIAFLDSDDLWKTDKLVKQIDLFHKSDIDVCYSDVEVIDADTNNELPYQRVAWFEQLRKGYILPYLIYYNFIPFASVIVRKECLEKINGMDESVILGDDWDLLLRLSTSCRFDYVDEKLLSYRAGHSTQLSQKIELRYKYQDLIIDKLFDQYPNLLPADYKKKTFAFRCRERASAFLRNDVRRSWQYLSKAFGSDPLNPGNYKILIKMIAYRVGVYKSS